MSRLGLAALLALAALALPARGEGLKAFEVRGRSMLPVVRPGEILVVDGSAAALSRLRRGDLVAVRLRGRGRPLLKRVAALPGDRLELRDGHLRVSVAGGASWPLAGGGGSRALLAQLAGTGGVVPAASLVLLSDNLKAGLDSRRLGFVPRRSLLGRVVASPGGAATAISR